MVDTFIKNAFIITMDKDRRILIDGAIAIQDGKILEIGRSSDLGAKYSDSKAVIDAKGKILLPGLVNTHVHLFQTLLKSLGDDLKLFDWCVECINPVVSALSDEDCYYGALAGCFEMIKSGITCASEFHYVFTKLTLGDQIVKAMLDSGIRGIVSRGFLDTDAAGIVPNLVEKKEDALKRSEEFARNWNGKGNGRIHIGLAPGPPPWGSPELLAGTRELSNRLGLPIAIHIAETLDEVESVKSLHKMRPIEFLNKVGILGPDVLAVHCVWLSDREIRILKGTGTKVSHNPVSNMYLASGIAPVTRMLEANIVVGLGTDGAASNNALDMFETMKVAALLQKVSNLDPTALTAEKVLEMATIDGAKALGLESEIGSIEVGKKADLIIVDLKKMNTTPINRVVSQLVYCAKGENVDTAIVDGNVIMEGRKLTKVDELSLIEKVQKISDRLSERSGIRHLRDRKWQSSAY
ncbi:MAG: amidohydrolase [Candidatus Bathyarchaeia archaeon]|nr:amidohydrolase [Candidatus Bathyarchaeota archaeon]